MRRPVFLPSAVKISQYKPSRDQSKPPLLISLLNRSAVNHESNKVQTMAHSSFFMNLGPPDYLCMPMVIQCDFKIRSALFICLTPKILTFRSWALILEFLWPDDPLDRFFANGFPPQESSRCPLSVHMYSLKNIIMQHALGKVTFFKNMSKNIGVATGVQPPIQTGTSHGVRTKPFSSFWRGGRECSTEGGNAR